MQTYSITLIMMVVVVQLVACPLHSSVIGLVYIIFHHKSSFHLVLVKKKWKLSATGKSMDTQY